MAKMRGGKINRKQILGKALRGGKKYRPRKTTLTPTGKRKVLVIIHGAGSFPEDWYKPTTDAIAKELGHPFDFIPVYFADLATRRVGTFAESPEEAKFKTDLENEFRQAYHSTKTNPAIPPERRVRAAALPMPVEQILGTVRLVADYFFAPNIRAEIQKRLIDKLDEAKQKKFGEIIFVAHSLGSLVGFDVLKQSADRYNIGLWFTTGAALAKLRRIGRYDDDLGAITTKNVKAWHNIYDTTDWIADPLGPAFPKPGYRLYDIFVDIGVDPNASHDYLSNAETIKLIANALR